MAVYRVGDPHFYGDPIGNMLALTEGVTSPLPVLAWNQYRKQWGWGYNVDDAIAAAIFDVFEDARSRGPKTMNVIRVGSSDTVAGSVFSEVAKRAEILREAERLITGERNQHYGEPTENFDNIADLFNTFLRYKLKDGEKITPGETAGLMILVKLAREMAGPREDNKTDIAGYAACWAEVDQVKES